MIRISPIVRISLPLVALAALAACGGGERADDPSPPADALASAPDGGVSQPHDWRANPGDGVEVRARGDTVTVETGPHAILWDAGVDELAPPYTLRARLQKRAGRLHEGVGLLFGGMGLEGPEGGQVYSYFLVRGDGSFLVKRRQGAETPVVRDWTTHPSVRRDAEEGGRPNVLEVQVGEADVVFRVNGAEVARVPAADLSVRGRAGLRASHDVVLEVAGFRADVGGAGGAAGSAGAAGSGMPAAPGTEADSAAGGR